MPLHDDVQIHVIDFIYSFTNITPDILLSKYLNTALVDDPLDFDDAATGALALTLRGYVQNIKLSATLLVGEVRTAGLTLQGLITLVYHKVK